jgi:hypothetical protein
MLRITSSSFPRGSVNHRVLPIRREGLATAFLVQSRTKRLVKGKGREADPLFAGCLEDWSTYIAKQFTQW